MPIKRIMFSPITRLSGLLSAEVFVCDNKIDEANVSSTMFRGFEWIMRDRAINDAVYLTQRVCGICSLAHGAVASYLLDEVYDNEITENAQYLRNIMYSADFLQNHLRHFYLFSLPDFVCMPNRPPFHGQDQEDLRLNPRDNQRMVEHYFEAIRTAQESHEILTLFGGKAPHQHSFLHGGVSVAPTADKVNRALALACNIHEFIKAKMLPDTELIARVYNDYYHIGVTYGRLLSFGLFRFGPKNEQVLWRSGVLIDGKVHVPNLNLIQEDISHAWFEAEDDRDSDTMKIEPAPEKQEGYTWIKSVKYAGWHFEVGPLARMILNGFYHGGTGTMDRIMARSLEAYIISGLMIEWLKKLIPGPPPIYQKQEIYKEKVTAVTDAMRGTLLHRVKIQDQKIVQYNIITPTVWNFSPKDKYGKRGPVEFALVSTEIKDSQRLQTILGRIIRSFDPCLACATHVLNVNEHEKIHWQI